MTGAGDRGPVRGPVPGGLLVVLLLLVLPLQARGEEPAPREAARDRKHFVGSERSERLPDFPDVEVLRKAPGRAPGLLLITPYYNAPDADAPASWLALLDDDGVPRFRRRVSPGAHNFRWHEHARRYSYNEAPPNGAGDVVLLDERLAEVARVGTVAGLAPAMMHEFLITEEGNYLFVVNEPAVRDFGRYPAPAPSPDPNPAPALNPDPAPAPDPDPNSAPAPASNADGDRPAPSSAEPTRDSVIQEVTPDGREVFRWNAWDHLKLSDCRWRLFPREYAKLNSLHLSAGGDLIASFRACSTILKIERPSGRVLWQLGGSDPAEPDPFDPRRPTFDRPWYRPAGDPRGGFCAQHTALETEPGRILMFDNGQCPDGDRPSSRVVEYQLGPGGEAAAESPAPGRGALEHRPGAGGEAAFVRHHEPGRLAVYGGAVAPLPNGNWLIAWGAGPGDGATLSEVAPSGREVLALRIFRNEHPAMTYRVQRHPGAQPPPATPTATTATAAAAPESPPGKRASDR